MKCLEKYKDCTPEKTIEKVKKFFINKGYRLEENQKLHPITNIYSCAITLYYNDIQIGSANGKGTTEIFSLASGYAELYERYCNYWIQFFIDSNLNTKAVLLNNKKNKGYYIASDELLNLNISNQKFIHFLKANPKFEKYIKENEYYNVSLPYQNIANSQDIKYYNYKLLHAVLGSDGMAAGNTLEEALVQACSELCEHYVFRQININPPTTLYKIDIKNIQLPDYINKIFIDLYAKNYTISVYDFSYNYKLPVVGVMIINEDEHTAYMNLGAAPVFDIALERCLTELYQGRLTLNKDKPIMVPFNTRTSNQVLFSTLKIKRSYASANTYPNIFFTNNNIFYCDINFDTFVKPLLASSNDFLFSYYIKLFKDHAWNVYYRDFSQCEDMFAVQCIVDNKQTCLEDTCKTYRFSKEENYKLANEWDEFIQNYLSYKDLSIDKKINQIFINYLSLIQKDLNATSYYSTMLIPQNYNFLNIELAQPSSCFEILFMYLDKNNYILNQHYIYEFPEYIRKKIQYYNILYLYGDNYSDSEILDIAKSFNITYTQNELNEKNNPIFYIENVLLKSVQEYWNSKDYQKVLQNF